MKVLVLGGTGFLGKKITDRLIENNHSVRVFSRQKQPVESKTDNSHLLEFFKGDLSNASDISRAIDGCTVIYHLIGTTIPYTSNQNPILDIQENLVSTVNMLDIAKTKKVEKVVYISSGGTVYGVPRQIPLREDHSTDPICSYGIVKLAIEKYLDLFYRNGGPDYTVLRLANPYGFHKFPRTLQGAASVFLKKAMNHELIEIWGDGEVVRDYVYIDDVVNAMYLALNYQGDTKVFNIGSNVGTSINQLLENIDSMLNYKTPRNYTDARQCDVPVNILDIKLADKFLVWAPAVSFKEGLHKLFLEMSAIEG